VKSEIAPHDTRAGSLAWVWGKLDIWTLCSDGGRRWVRCAREVLR